MTHISALPLHSYSFEHEVVLNKKAKKYGIYNYNLQDKINSSELTTNIIDKTIKVYDSIKKMHIIIGTIKVIGIIIRWDKFL